MSNRYIIYPESGSPPWPDDGAWSVADAAAFVSATAATVAINAGAAGLTASTKADTPVALVTSTNDASAPFEPRGYAVVIGPSGQVWLKTPAGIAWLALQPPLVTTLPKDTSYTGGDGLGKPWGSAKNWPAF